MGGKELYPNDISEYYKETVQQFPKSHILHVNDRDLPI